MAYFATKRITYWGQFGVLTAFTGVGFVIGGLAGLVPLIGKIKAADFSSPNFLNQILTPENTNALRWMNSITNLFFFFLPPIAYGLICHQKPFVHLGFKQKVNWSSAGLVILIMIAALPMVGALQELTEMLPWSKAALLKFKLAEDDYNKAVGIMAKMDNFGEYLVAMFVIALLPAIFEETLFRGAIQNLLSRWFKMPILGIVVTAIVFSALHGSYLGFLSRFALGAVLGWIYYRTGNLWLSIIGHFFNNAFGVTVMYLAKKPGGKPDPSALDESLPLWAGLISALVVYALFIFFEKISKQEIDHPGEEIPLPGVQFKLNPFADNDSTSERTRY
ncbi:MAG: CPBP family intramembrane glutamic endopeptidase [Ferruginibacter sp.]